MRVDFWSSINFIELLKGVLFYKIKVPRQGSVTHLYLGRSSSPSLASNKQLIFFLQPSSFYIYGSIVVHRVRVARAT
jgi:hypothetical protein